MKYAVVTVHTAEFQQFSKYTIPLISMYCKKHNIDFFEYDEAIDKTRHPAWSKPLALLNHIRDYDWLLWIDSDAAFVNHDKTLDYMIQDTDATILMGKDSNGWNSGVFFIRNCQKAIDWLMYIDKQTERVNASGLPWRDQRAMLFADEEPEFENIRTEVSRKEFNTYYTKSQPDRFQDGDIILHMPNESNNNRERIFKRYYDKYKDLSIVKKEANIITNYTEKKLVEYLEDGMSVRIDYPHGLGDVLMFMPYYYRLRELYPKVDFYIQTTPDKQPLLGELPDITFDYIFKMSMHFNESDGIYKGKTKPECNCFFDIGMEYDKSIEYQDVLYLEQYMQKDRQYIGFCWFSTHHSYNTDCDYELAKYMWYEAIEKGYTPIELQFYQSGNVHNIHNRRFDFATNTMREESPDIFKLLEIAGQCKGIAAVSTGPFHLSSVMMPENTLYLKKGFDISYYTNRSDIKQADIMRNKTQAKDGIDKWLDSLV